MIPFTMLYQSIPDIEFQILKIVSIIWIHLSYGFIATNIEELTYGLSRSRCFSIADLTENKQGKHRSNNYARTKF